MPQCGFSAHVIGLLEQHQANYVTFDILQDMEVRQGLKEFSNWPTYPQLYVGGKFIGGCDIVNELEEDGELADVLMDEQQHYSPTLLRLKYLSLRSSLFSI